MDEETEDLLIKGGAIIGAYFFVVKPIMNTIGVSSADSSTVAAQSSLAPSNNPFSPLFAPFVNMYSPEWAGTTEQALFLSYKQNWEFAGSSMSLNGSETDLVVYAEQINNSFGYILHDTNTVVSIFNNLSTQVDVAWIAAYLYYNYNTDLLTLLTNGAWTLLWAKSGLSDTDLASIINKVNNLPVQ